MAYLEHIRVRVFCVFNDDSLTSAKRVRNRMLAGIEYRLAAVGCLYYVVLRATHAVRLGTPVQHKLAPATTTFPRWQKAIVPRNKNLICINKL